MGLVGSGFTGGTATLSFLLAAEVIAAAAVVSEAALIYVARHRNMAISLIMLAHRGGVERGPDHRHARRPLALGLASDRAGDRFVPGAGFASIAKSRLLARTLAAPVSGWRWDIGWAAAAGIAIGVPARLFLPPVLQLAIGIPAMLGAFGAVLWLKGFGPEDRELFRLRKDDIEDLRAAEARAQWPTISSAAAKRRPASLRTFPRCG